MTNIESVTLGFFKNHGYLPRQFNDSGYMTFAIKKDSFNIASNAVIAYDMTPQQAMEYLKKKSKKMKVTQDWESMNSEAHQTAFTVAKVATADLLQEIYKEIESAKNDGVTSADFAKLFPQQLKTKLEQSGWTGANPSRLKLIYDTNCSMAYSKGVVKAQQLLKNQYPYLEYRQIERPHKRHSHSAYHGKVFSIDDPIWSSITPPAGFRCGCFTVPISEEEAKRKGMTIRDGKDFQEIVNKNKTDFAISPLKAWEVETGKYSEGIRNALKTILSKTTVTKTDAQKTEKKKDDNLAKEYNLMPIQNLLNEIDALLTSINFADIDIINNAKSLLNKAKSMLDAAIDKFLDTQKNLYESLKVKYEELLKRLNNQFVTAKNMKEAKELAKSIIEDSTNLKIKLDLEEYKRMKRTGKYPKMQTFNVD